MAIITFRMPVLEIKVETDLEKYFPENQMTVENVNTKAVKIILEEAVKKALESKKTSKKIGAFLSSAVFRCVECETFSFGHLLADCSFTKDLELKI
ncbi:hypothetical protein ES703_87973 [subsurface metagenome]